MYIHTHIRTRAHAHTHRDSGATCVVTTPAYFDAHFGGESSLLYQWLNLDARYKFLKSTLSLVTLYSTCTRALPLQNFCNNSVVLVLYR